ncbi:hypothetical protein NS365_04625 [Aureimonas ureilytica]|uniref:Uncharacterized protein n=1 Tax=Aureimonas ureilytica TaxID=401562 RepID=A0A175RWL3_9HYPH|nr:hypothetical protein [Aureimonas ureilytica]KTR07344.1 hypothetical protein NS365_04625 [Aureimonas ureilytica]
MIRKPIEIRTLLAWVYGEEMPKREAFENDVRLFGGVSVPSTSAWDAISRLAILGVRVDTSGPAPDNRALVYPDPDAVLVDEAVMRLEMATIAMPDGWDALGDLAEITDLELTEAERVDAHRNGWDIAIPKGDRLSAHVIRQASVDRVPAWRDHGRIERRPKLGANGKPAWFRVVNEAGPGEPARPREVDGYNRSRQRPYKGAYRRYYLDPCPSLLVAARIEYQAWALALHQITNDVQGKLSRFDVSCRVPLWPWEGEGRGSSPRVLSVRSSTDAPREPSKAA